MANFVATVDPDPDRRARFVARVRPLLAPVEGLGVEGIEMAPFEAVWAASARAPVTAARSPAEGEAHVLWGDAFVDGRAAGSSSLPVRWAPLLEGGTAATLDGYHAGVFYRRDAGLVAGSDLLGLFPLYYASSGDAVLIGSSPALFRYHPGFRHALDPIGLVGILLLSGPVAGRTLLEGVRRLSAGRLLLARPGVEPGEVPYYSMPDRARLADAPFEAQVRALDAAFAQAVARQVPAAGPVGLLLSGGHDSRQYAGYLRDRGDGVEALTFGLPTDHDAACARRVARKLGFRHRVHEIEPDGFPAAARQQIRWEQLATGFTTVHMWSALDPLRNLPPRFVTGYYGDVFFSGRAAYADGVSFERAFPVWNGLGIEADTLGRLLSGGAASGLVGAVIDDVRRGFEAASADPAQKGRRLQAATTTRYHAGSVPWRLTFSSWPVLPFLDRDVLETIAAMPAASLAERRLQTALLVSRFPDLARLPLDRNSRDTSPLLPSRRERWRLALARWPGFLRPGRRPPVVERRYFHRMYDFNGPGWLAIRAMAEPHRHRLEGMFEMDALSRYLPPPAERMGFEDTVWGSAGRKLLIGLMLWAGDYLS